mmetsp:Transcript_56960/g.129056  ORF Transcript_56960/g.129056 Transcript_56960/m.129056 type:complete len:241 (-) Transcript_56960:108-830(-)
MFLNASLKSSFCCARSARPKTPRLPSSLNRPSSTSRLSFKNSTSSTVPLLFSSARSKAKRKSRSVGVSYILLSISIFFSSTTNASCLSSALSLPTPEEAQACRNISLTVSNDRKGFPASAFLSPDIFASISFRVPASIPADFLAFGVPGDLLFAFGVPTPDELFPKTFALPATSFSGLPTPPSSSAARSLPTSVSAFTSACLMNQHHSSSKTIPPPLSSISENMDFASFFPLMFSRATNP